MFQFSWLSSSSSSFSFGFRKIPWRRTAQLSTRTETLLLNSLEDERTFTQVAPVVLSRSCRSRRSKLVARPICWFTSHFRRWGKWSSGRQSFVPSTNCESCRSWTCSLPVGWFGQPAGVETAPFLFCEKKEVELFWTSQLHHECIIMRWTILLITLTLTWSSQLMTISAQQSTAGLESLTSPSPSDGSTAGSSTARTTTTGTPGNAKAQQPSPTPASIASSLLSGTFLPFFLSTQFLPSFLPCQMLIPGVSVIRRIRVSPVRFLLRSRTPFSFVHP